MDERAPDDRHPLAWLNLPLLGLVRLYQLTLSPILGGHCRFRPTCSHYAAGVLRRHHPIRAVGLVAWRLGRCHPLGGGGFDPVPPLPGTTPGNPGKPAAPERS